VLGDVLVLDSIEVGEERSVARNPFLLGRGVSMKRTSRVAFERKDDMFRGGNSTDRRAESEKTWFA